LLYGIVLYGIVLYGSLLYGIVLYGSLLPAFWRILLPSSLQLP